MTCVIFGGADIKDYSEVWVPEEAVVIAADRGYIHCKTLGIIPDALVGDFDSLEGELPCNVSTVTAPCEKDDTDLIMAVREGIKLCCTHFLIYGADGGRMGHTFANIQTLSFISAKGLTGELRGKGFDMLVQVSGKRSYTNKGYRYVSVFSLTDSAQLSVKGLKYGGSFTLHRSYPMGVSNEFTGEGCEITVHSGEILVIFEKE